MAASTGVLLADSVFKAGLKPGVDRFSGDPDALDNPESPIDISQAVNMLSFTKRLAEAGLRSCIERELFRILAPFFSSLSSSSFKKPMSKSKLEMLTSHSLNVNEYLLLSVRALPSPSKDIMVLELIVDSFSSVAAFSSLSSLSSSSESSWNRSRTESKDDDTDFSLIGVGCFKKSASLVSMSLLRLKHAIVEFNEDIECDGLSASDGT
ncbi:hypothetical protein OGATHE_002894 [Ogataea polymorpha]|uniref:Uncharacterized protein n=1 Tax=Ogataea polymorpha TaxID=460523 RepID=A0A9P8T8R1_9ASCO|nr:hypothetical protein OGATHE_002894 [Ogataea polymorpha]